MDPRYPKGDLDVLRDALFSPYRRDIIELGMRLFCAHAVYSSNLSP